MNEAVLLLDAVPMRDMDFRSPVFYDRQCGPNEVHGVLLVETCRDGFGEIGIGRRRHVIKILIEGTELDFPANLPTIATHAKSTTAPSSINGQ